MWYTEIYTAEVLYIYIYLYYTHFHEGVHVNWINYEQIILLYIHKQ